MRTIERSPSASPSESPIAACLMIGFFAGFLSVLVFSNGTVAILDMTGVPVAFAPWSMQPTSPFGVPRTISSAFWGGLWGVLYALLEPRLTARLGWWSGGLAFGALPLLVFWFVVPPLKGAPIAGGFSGTSVALGVVLHAAFGLGTAIAFRFGRHLTGRNARLSARTP